MKITNDGESAKKFVKMLINRGHEAMIEHSSLSLLLKELQSKLPVVFDDIVADEVQ